MSGSAESPLWVQPKWLSVVVLGRGLTPCVGKSTKYLAMRSSTLPLMTDSAEKPGQIWLLAIASEYHLLPTNVLSGISV